MSGFKPALALRALIADRQANVMVMFAGMAFGIVLMVGAGVDYTRATQFKTQLQNAADEAALAGAGVYVSAATAASATTAATNYFNAAKAKLPPSFSVGTPSIDASSDANGYYITVSVSASIKTTFLSLLSSTIPVAVYAKAKDPIVTATVNLNGWSSDAGDGNSIYWYKVPSDDSIPAFTAANISNNTFNLIFSNVVNTSPTLSFQIAAGQQMGFAFVNQTGLHSPGWYYCNQYGGCSTANSNDTHIFYSQVSNPNGVNSTTAPNGYGYTDGTKYNGGTVQNCSLQVTAYSGTAPTGPASTGSCFTPPATLPQYFSPSCASLGGNSVHYAWNDMGGGTDDRDYNDGQYNFSCTGGGTTTGVILTD
jgi:Flp pilus assembly protein TadG